MPLDDLHTEYCMMESFQPRCWKNEVILMTSSIYGRMDRNARCLESDPWKDDPRYMDCFADVLSLTDRRCSGRRECDIALPNTEFHRTKPCGTANVFMYLEATFQCVVGMRHRLRKSKRATPRLGPICWELPVQSFCNKCITIKCLILKMKVKITMFNFRHRAII